MLTEHAIHQTISKSSSGSMSAEIDFDQQFKSEGLNFANDFYTTDKQMRLTLSSLQMLENTDSKKVIRGIEMVFAADVVSGTYSFQDKQVSATFWMIFADDQQSLYRSFGADQGSVTLEFDEEKENCHGTFSFTSNGPGATVLTVRAGEFSVSGRDDFTL
ncbi:hypothetical protein [Pseudomonas prosekii]|uniref:hypothetical protein n=1 Tax=Pseudomonas prosekii TaxID=1148509 RepID=UPI00387AA8E2